MVSERKNSKKKASLKEGEKGDAALALARTALC